jgi:outer membrane protein OmpA-like peptidoglycan-associated protein
MMKSFVRSRAFIVAAALLPVTAGCANMSGSQKGAVIGAGGGAAVGAAIGKAAGSTAKGAIIGAAIGGVAGGVIGNQMDKQKGELAGDLENATVERVGEGLLITFDSGLLFDYDSDAVKGAARENLTDLAASLQKYPNTEILIVGHTDAQGSDSYNLDLSRRRAESARRFLSTQGIASNRIRTEGRGESEPIGTDAQNRRVEVAIFADAATRAKLQSQYGK